MKKRPTHEVRVRPIHSGTGRITFDVSMREFIERQRPGRSDPPHITIRLTITEDDVREDFNNPAWLPDRLGDRRYLLAKVRQALERAAIGPWSEQDSRTIHLPGSPRDPQTDSE